MTEELKVLQVISDRLESTGIGDMLTGSMAMSYDALPRMTRDIDVVVELAGAEADRLCALFEVDFYRRSRRRAGGRRRARRVGRATTAAPSSLAGSPPRWPEPDPVNPAEAQSAAHAYPGFQTH